MMKPHVRRAVSLLLLALALGVTCTFLGRWQWNRHVARDAQIRLIEDNYSAEPVPLSALVATPGVALPDDAMWRQVTVTGRYEANSTVLLRNRPIGGMAGYHVLVPLVVADGGEAGAVLVVDRGSVPTGENGSEVAAVPAPPAGTVTVTVRLRSEEAPSPRSAPPHQVQAISVDQVSALLAATDGDDIASLRDKALLELMYATGARVSEAVGLNVDDVIDADVVRLTGKGSKQRIVPLGKAAHDAIREAVA